jgi:hypothetical protein
LAKERIFDKSILNDAAADFLRCRPDGERFEILQKAEIGKKALS